MKNQILTTFKSLTLALLLIAGVSYAWTGPTNTAPDGNVPAPINVGSVSQTKTGPFWANGLLSTGGGYFAGNVEISGTGPSGGFYFDGNDDAWLRLRNADGGTYKDFAADDLYAANNVYADGGIRLGGVYRTTWPSTGGTLVVTTVTGPVSACRGYSTATCPSGYEVVGGGYDWGASCGCEEYHRFPVDSKPSGNGWTVLMECSTVQAKAMCAKIQ